MTDMTAGDPRPAAARRRAIVLLTDIDPAGVQEADLSSACAAYAAANGFDVVEEVTLTRDLPTYETRKWRALIMTVLRQAPAADGSREPEAADVRALASLLATDLTLRDRGALSAVDLLHWLRESTTEADAVILGHAPGLPEIMLLMYWLRSGLEIHSVSEGRLTEVELRRELADSFSPPRMALEKRSGDVQREQELLLRHRKQGKSLNDPDPDDELAHWGGSNAGVVAGSLPAGAWDSLRNSQPRGLPIATRDEPLPHDGLFIRRNNAYGSKSAADISELIDHGILPDQTQISFDDFVASDVDRVPGPPPGQGLAVSHGSASATGAFKAHASTSHFLEIALKTADTAPEGPASDRQPLPVNFVFVIDTSGSMQGAKLDYVKSAINALYNQLRDTDVLGLVTFDTQVRTLLRATPKSQLPVERLAGLVGGLVGGGGTDINLGIRYGIDEIRRHASIGQHVNCLYVFSDGDPTSGETNWINIRADVASRTRGEITVSCFGFGSDARMRELDALAGLTGGHSRFVTHADDVRLDLAEDLTRRDHLAAINVQLKIDIPPQVKIRHFYGHDLVTDPAARAAVENEARAAGAAVRRDFNVEPLPDLIRQETGIRVFTPDLAFGETYWIVLELELPDGGQPQPAALGAAAVQFFDTVTRQNRSLELSLSDHAGIPAETVLTHALGLRTSEVAFYAIDDLYQNDRNTAKARLTNHIRLLREAYAYHPAPQFQNDSVTISKLISLSENLGQPLRWNEDRQSPFGSVVFAMNAFGQVRGGHYGSGWSRAR